MDTQRFSLDETIDRGRPLLDDDFIDLRVIWRVLNRYKAGIAGLGILSAIVTGLVVSDMPNIYQSTATLMIEQNRRNLVSIEEVYGIDAASREYFSTQAELLQSRNLSERVIRELSLAEHPEFRPPDPSQSSPMDTIESFVLGLIPGLSAEAASIAAEPDPQEEISRLVGQFRARLSVAPIRNTDLIQISFESQEPRIAAEIANSLANNYVQADLEQRVTANQQANAYLSDRLESLRQNLESSETRLQDFLEREDLVDIQGVETLKVRELDDLNTRSIEARRNRADLEVIYRQISGASNLSPEEMMNYPAVLNHPSVRDSSVRADALDQEIAELSNRYGRNHPRMIALVAERDSIQTDLTRQVGQVMGSIENDFENARVREQEIEASVRQTTNELQEIRSKSFELRELQREANTNQQLYDMFFTRFRETGETEEFQTAQAILVDPAVPATEPIKPRRRLIVALAGMLGLLIGIGIAFLRHALDNTIKTPGDVEEKLETQTLGILPLVKEAIQEKGRKKMSFLGMIQDEHSTFSESVRTIRTAITLSSIDDPFRVIEVTSSIPNEGKSTVAANLAVAMGKLQKVLLVDTDMRRPSLANSVGLEPNTRGLCDALAGEAKYSECIYRYKPAEIHIMPLGRIPPNPLELLSSKKFKKLIEQLKEHFDLIILDTPPTQAVSDALILGTVADACIYVVKSDFTSLGAIRNGLKRMSNSGARILGVVLNQVAATKGNAYYYQGYYDSYGYSSYGGKPKSA